MEQFQPCKSRPLWWARNYWAGLLWHNWPQMLILYLGLTLSKDFSLMSLTASLKVVFPHFSQFYCLSDCTANMQHSENAHFASCTPYQQTLCRQILAHGFQTAMSVSVTAPFYIIVQCFTRSKCWLAWGLHAAVHWWSCVEGHFLFW